MTAAKDPQPFLLKEFFNRDFIEHLANAVAGTKAPFKKTAFMQDVLDADHKNRELKQRMRHTAAMLRRYLPEPYTDAVEILMKASPHVTGFGAMVLPDFVEQFGLEHYDQSIAALELFTQSSSSEFAVRPFLIRYGATMERQMVLWSGHENHHVRRLSSEGIRPRLPWAQPLPHLKADPSPIWPILENLNNDDSDYVRRSVANNLNDISKDHPNLVIARAKTWYGQSEATNGIIRHACRTLIKAGNQEVLELLGEGSAKALQVALFTADDGTVSIGNHTFLETHIRNTADRSIRLRLAYAIDFVKANGSVSRKVFSWQIVELGASETRAFRRKHRFQQFTTRTHYPGSHRIHCIVNGEDRATITIALT